ncbi:uroporphyrinogen-III synthase [Listeria rocourtiae]|uniref:uroporphyrinogen-III synthase n=1 Tax=Listeria rocourtiae TaxID=647910 RepID=UPI003D2F556D
MSKHILLTREVGKNETSQLSLERAGFQVSIVPMIETRPCKCQMALGDYDWIVFTSANTVRYFFEQQAAIPSHVKIAVIGEKTAEMLASNQYNPDFLPTRFTTDIFIDEWLALDLNQQQIFIPKSNIARDEIERQFKNAGHLVTSRAIYETVSPERAREQLQSVTKSSPIDIAVFASPSAWHHFLKSYTDDVAKLKIASIGPVTTRAIELSGFAVTYAPTNYTMRQVCEILIKGEQ